MPESSGWENNEDFYADILGSNPIIIIAYAFG